MSKVESYWGLRLLLGSAASLTLAGLAALSVTAGTSGTVRAAGAGQVDRRQFEFPKDKSIGTLMFVTENRPRNLPEQLAGAKGTVTVVVPPHSLLLFEANRRVYENPDCLDKVTPRGIDGLRLSFTSMDDRETGMGDRAIAHVSHFKDTQLLYIENSDASDEGLKALKDMPKLAVIYARVTNLKGTCFKNLQSLPKLRELDLAWTPLDLKNIGDLAGIPSLDELSLQHSGMNEAAMKSLSKCTGLVKLGLGDNSRVGDSSLKYLLGMKKLRTLDLLGTAVTVSGLKTLTALPLQYVKLPRRITAADALALKPLFPKTLFEVVGKPGGVDKDYKEILAPLR